MTAIAALIHNGQVYMGGDSACTNGLSISTDPQPKVWVEDNGMMIGTAGSVRSGDLMRYAFAPPPLMEGQDVNAYMRVTFPAALRDCLREHRFIETEGGHEDCHLSALIGWRGQLWELGGDFSVIQSAEPYMAIGSGGELALAVLHATADLDPETRLRRALETAERFNAGVRAPFTLLIPQVMN